MTKTPTNNTAGDQTSGYGIITLSGVDYHLKLSFKALMQIQDGVKLPIYQVIEQRLALGDIEVAARCFTHMAEAGGNHVTLYKAGDLILENDPLEVVEQIIAIMVSALGGAGDGKKPKAAAKTKTPD